MNKCFVKALSQNIVFFMYSFQILPKVWLCPQKMKTVVNGESFRWPVRSTSIWESPS